jgi:type II secretory pathway pseudopilin PulG
MRILWRGARPGMTLVETLLAAMIAVSLLTSFYLVFSRSVGSTMKGEDTLSSIREATLILEDIRREALAAARVASPTATAATGAAPFDLTKPEERLILVGSHGTIRYEMRREGSRQWLEKTTLAGGEVVRTQRFAENRLQEFGVFWLEQKQQPGMSVFRSRAILIILDVQGSTPGWPARSVKVHTLVSPPFTAKEHSTWPG